MELQVPVGLKVIFYFNLAYLFFNDTFKIKKINSDEVTNVSI